MNDKTNSIEGMVSEFLRENPDFLERHPKLLMQLNLAHQSGEAISLIERQVEQLRQQNHKLVRQLNQLVQVASENEALMNRLHDLTLELMLIDDLGRLFDRLNNALLEEFKADIINITLLDRDIGVGKNSPVYKVASDDPEFKPFLAHLEKGESTCGRLNRNKLDFLFGQRAQWVQSTALVPLGDEGLLAIGSSDPARFYPGMGTLFLDLLAKVILRKLALAEPEKQRRTA